MNTTPPIPWAEFPAECLWYLVPMSVLHLAVFAVGCLTAVMVSRGRPGKLRRRIGRFALFIGLLLIVGSLFNGLWSCLVYNRLYHSTDHIFDFIPFWPISWIAVDTPWGDGHGQLFTPLFVLNFVWLVFAVGTWAVTAFLYQILRRRLPPNKRSVGGGGVRSLLNTARACPTVPDHGL
jgi:hypothetical protein